MSYQYWNNFIDSWRGLNLLECLNTAPAEEFQSLLGWSNPNLMRLYGTENNNDLSLQYLPEPWWGNNGTSPLESVIINYNPAGLNDNFYGQNAEQHITNSNGLFGFNNYSDFINNEVLTQSSRFPGKYHFHFSTRARRIFESLNRNHVTLLGNGLQNHLSIELAPWYTPKSKFIEPYIMLNADIIYRQCIVFAADRSMLIHNPVLKNKVIIRASKNFTEKFLQYCGEYNVLRDYTTNSGNGRFFKFSLNSIPNIQFISIWGIRARNDFPANIDLDEILGVI